jgi:hypothetical protein
MGSALGDESREDFGGAATHQASGKVPHALHVLAPEEIECLLQQPSRTNPIGLRDLALLEVPYGSGLRVSELVNLPLQALHLTEGWLKVRGKEGKEQLALLSFTLTRTPALCPPCEHIIARRRCRFPHDTGRHRCIVWSVGVLARETAMTLDVRGALA